MNDLGQVREKQSLKALLLTPSIVRTIEEHLKLQAEWRP
jgi:hypothetical protein